MSATKQELAASAEDEGYEAFLLGMPRYQNPYQPDAPEFYSWAQGWDNADEESKT